MADQRKRQLERAAAAAPDDVQAQAALLLERLRVGELALGRVELAAYCGDPVARRVIYGHLPDWISPSHTHIRDDAYGRAWSVEPLPDWASRLQSLWGREVCVRAAVTAARLALPVWEEGNLAPHACFQSGAAISCAAPEQHAPLEAIEAAERWLEDQSEENAQAAGDAAVAGLPRWAMIPAAGAYHPGVTNMHSGPVDAAELVGEQAIRNAVQRALIEWTGVNRG